MIQKDRSGYFYIVTIGLSAFLLFQVQPLLSRLILPLFGGGASIWLTCLVFFQTILLMGYASCHWAVNRLGIRRHCYLQIGVTAISLAFLPISMSGTSITSSPVHPSLQIFFILLLTVGLPYYVLSTTSPTIQYWIAHDPRTAERNPYIQYAVSNAGSLAGLLTFPFLVEPLLGNTFQRIAWSLGYVLYALFSIGVAISLLRQHSEVKDQVLDEKEKNESGRSLFSESESAPENRDTLRWVVQAMIPSAALLVVTYYLTVDIVNAPLLWIIPLTLYLLSFVACFTFSWLNKPGSVRTLLCFLPVAALFVVRRLGGEIVPFWFQITIACGALFAVCVYFHGELERSKPLPRYLTSFYLYLSFGGVLGSLAVGVLAPLLFSSTYEFNIVIIAALGFMMWPHFIQRTVVLKAIAAMILVLLVCITWVTEEMTVLSFLLHKERSYYGSYEVQEFPEIPGKRVGVRLLVMGTTIHGGEAHDASGNLMPITYFHEKSGVGRAFECIPEIRDVGVVGLGTGVVALYGTPQRTFTFFELDPIVEKLAREWFGNLRESKARIRVQHGDARLRLRDQHDASFDMLILDAFTSGAIPTHLLTVEAMREYFRVLRQDGLVLFHISNRHVDLWPVLQGAARELNLLVKFHQAEATPSEYKTAASWVVLTRNSNRFIRLTGKDDRWIIKSNKTVLWTDDFFTLWSVMNFGK